MGVSYIYILKPKGGSPHRDNHIVVSGNKLSDVAAFLYSKGSNINFYETSEILEVRGRLLSLKLLAGKLIKNKEENEVNKKGKNVKSD